VSGPGRLVGAAIGRLISLSDAIVPRTYTPNLVIGGIGGGLIGCLTL
jgi:hypothetical protein